jgi:hypothetical protein
MRDSDNRTKWINHEVWRADLKTSDDKGLCKRALVKANAHTIPFDDAVALKVESHRIENLFRLSKVTISQSDHTRAALSPFA